MRTIVVLLLLIDTLIHTTLSQSNLGPRFLELATDGIDGNLKDRLQRVGIDENLLEGIYLGRLSATDPDSPVLTYYSDTGQGSPVKVNEMTGDVYTLEPLNYELSGSGQTTNDVSVTFRVRDNVGNEASTTYKITVNDVNDQSPIFTTYILKFSVPESAPIGTTVFSVTAVDADSPKYNNFNVTCVNNNGTEKISCDIFQIKNVGIDSGKKRIDIVTRTPIDFESIQFTSNVLTLEASDGQLKSRINVLYDILDTQDTPPVFDYLPYFFQVYENTPIGTQVFATIAAHDGNTGSPNPIVLSLDETNLPSALRGLFTLTSTFLMANKISYQAPLIVAGNIDRENLTSYLPTINLNVVATERNPDGTMSAKTMTSAAITILDVDDNGPRFDKSNYIVYVREQDKSVSSTNIVQGFTFFITDPDGVTFNEYNVTIREQTYAGTFSLDTSISSGTTTFYLIIDRNDLMNYDEPSYRTQIIKIEAFDTYNSTLRSSATVTVSLTDVNDNEPEFAVLAAKVTVRENALVGDSLNIVLTATDKDSGLNGQIEYQLKGTGTNKFKVNPVTGTITVAEPLNYEDTSFYALIFTAKDKGTPSLEKSITLDIEVLNVNDLGPVFASTYQTVVTESSTTLLIPVTVQVTVSYPDTNPVITNLTFTIRMTEMNFTDDLNNSSSVIYLTTKNKLVQTLDMLLGHFQGYSGAHLLHFRRGSVKADVQVSVNQIGNISTIQAALKQSVSLGFIGLNGTTIAVDSTYFISYIREGYTILDGIYITNAGDIYNGSLVNITCMTTLVGNATPSIIWKYNGNDMNPVAGSRIRISTILVDLETPQRINKTVTFNRIQSSDSGTYECVVMDGNLSLISMNKTVIVISQPEVFIQPVTQTVDAGSTINIMCRVRNDVPITQMVWYRNGTEINSANKLSEENISNGNTTNILTHTNIQYTTKYECRGDNAAGQGNMRQAMIYVALSGSNHGETCKNETDQRGIKWSRTLQGKYDNKSCPTGMLGEAVRYCSQGGVWSDPSYDNCINEALLALQILTDNIKNGLSPNTVQDSLVNLTHLTNPENVELQKADVQIVSTILDNIVQISNHTENITNTEIENFLEIASNVIDVKNRPSWEALISKDQVGASIILRNVEQYSIIKAKSTNSPDEPVKRFTKKNLFVEIGYNLVGDIQFPSTTANGSAFNNSSSSRFVLSHDALKNGNYTSYAGAYFNNVSGIVQKNLLDNGSIINTGDNLEINSAVLSLQLDQPTFSLSPPLTLTFKHFSANYSNPKCSFWMFNEDGRGNGSWSGEGCKLVSTSDDTTVCQCDHLTNFAILMSPGKTPAKDQVYLSIISIIGCAISICCLSVTMVAHLIVWRYVKSARSHLLMNLCTALIISYVIFLAGVDRTENKNACTAVAALLHYFYLSVFFLLLAFGIEITVSVIYVFVTRSRIRWLLPIAWILPAVIVAISLGVTELEGYGNKKFCWLSIEGGLIWAFVGPAALVILLNFIIIIVVFHRMFSSSAMLTKSNKVKAKTAVRSLCVLLPITGITWVFGILSVNEDLVVFQYLFAIINSLQGLLIFLFNCVFNHHLKEAIKQMNVSRKRSQVPVSMTLKSSSHTSGPKTRDTLDENQKNKASDIEAPSTNSFLGSDQQMENRVETYAKDDQLNTEYVESSTNIQDKRCGHNISIQDVKISNILHDTNVRRELDHAQVATISTTRANANTSADIEAGDSTSVRELETKERSTATRARKAKDITRAKKHGKKNKRSLHYQYSAFDMVHMGPQIYHDSSQNIAGWISYNPYGGVHAYRAPWMYTMNSIQFHQPQRQKSGKKML